MHVSVCVCVCCHVSDVPGDGYRFVVAMSGVDSDMLQHVYQVFPVKVWCSHG